MLPSKKYKGIILTIFGISLFLLIIFLNREVSFDSFTNINLGYLILAFIFIYLAITLEAGRWGWIINILTGKKILPYRKYFFYYSLSAMFGIIGIQEVSVLTTQLGTLSLEKIPPSKIINAYLVNKIINTINLISICWISILYFLNFITLQTSIVFVIITFFCTYFIISIKKINFTALVFYFNKLIIKMAKLIPALKKKQFSESSEKIIISSKILKKLYLISILKFSFLTIATFFVFKSLKLNIDISQVFLALPISQLSIVFSFTPGALGIMETGWFIILKTLAFSAVNINTFLIGYRVITYPMIILVALINYLIFLSIREKKA